MFLQQWIDPDAPPLSGEGLESLTREYMAARGAMQRLSNRYDAKLLRQMIDYQPFSRDWSEQEIANWCAGLSARLNAGCPPSVRYELEPLQGETGLGVRFSQLTHGVSMDQEIRHSFFGSIVPHLMRLLVGSDHRILLPAAALFGGTFLVLSDTLARTVVAPRQLPVGVITALLGVPLFLLLLNRARLRAGAQ